MTLAAAILFVGISSLASVDPGFAPQFTPPSGSSASAPSAQPSSLNQAEPRASTPSADQSPSTRSSTAKPKATAAKKNRRRNKVASTEACDPSTTNVNPTGSAPAAGSPQPGNTQAQVPSASDAPKNCPPPKIVVRQGGVSEQSIQLAGGSTKGETTQRRESTHQMLATTEENLKKVASIQLSTDQQSSVSQIRQFVSQSKSALAAADFERAQTLAWKAKVLSEDLVNPKK
jgi:hypothetical protein